MDVHSYENEVSLRPGDILVFHGHGFVRGRSAGSMSRDVIGAAIVLRPETMAEATASGLRHVAIGPASRATRSPIIANVVSPGDLRYSHSLETMTSLRPLRPFEHGVGRPKTKSHGADR